MEGVCVCDTNLFEPQYRCDMNRMENEKSDDQAGTISSDSVQSLEECETRCQENPDCSVANFIENPDNFFCILFDVSYTGSVTEDLSTAIYKDCNNRPGNNPSFSNKSVFLDTVFLFTFSNVCYLMMMTFVNIGNQ